MEQSTTPNKTYNRQTWHTSAAKSLSPRYIQCIHHSFIHSLNTLHISSTAVHRKQHFEYIDQCIIMVQILIQPYSVTFHTDLVSVLLKKKFCSLFFFPFSVPNRSVSFDSILQFDRHTYSSSSFFLVPASTYIACYFVIFILSFTFT